MAEIREIRFGIEIETVGQSRKTVGEAIRNITGGTLELIANRYEITDRQNRVWKVVPDASLTNVSDNLRAEVVSPILRYADIDELQEVVRAIRKCGAQADEKCGIHIHVSHPDVTPAALANLAKMVYKQEEIIYAALGVSKTRMERYCKPIDKDFIDKISAKTPQTMKELNKAWYGHYIERPERYHQSRYSILNYNGYFLRGAVEIRAYAGSLHAGEVKAAIIFSMALMVRAMNAKSVSAKKRTYTEASGKYDMRVFLISALKLNGDEFKNTRMHLLRKLSGSAAWKNGRPVKNRQDAA